MQPWEYRNPDECVDDTKSYLCFCVAVQPGDDRQARPHHCDLYLRSNRKALGRALSAINNARALLTTCMRSHHGHQLVQAARWWMMATILSSRQSWHWAHGIRGHSHTLCPAYEHEASPLQYKLCLQLCKPSSQSSISRHTILPGTG